MSKTKKEERTPEQEKSLAIKLNEINQAALDRRKAFREKQTERALQERIASQKSSRGPSRAGRLSGAAVLGGGSWGKAANLGKR